MQILRSCNIHHIPRLKLLDVMVKTEYIHEHTHYVCVKSLKVVDVQTSAFFSNFVALGSA